MSRLGDMYSAVSSSDYSVTATHYYYGFDQSTSRSSYGPSNRFYAYPLRCLSTAVEGEESEIKIILMLATFL